MDLWPTKKCFVYVALDIMIMIKRGKGTSRRRPRKYGHVSSHVSSLQPRRECRLVQLPLLGPHGLGTSSYIYIVNTSIGKTGHHVMLCSASAW